MKKICICLIVVLLLWLLFSPVCLAFSSEYYNSEDFDVYVYSHEEMLECFERCEFSVQTDIDNIPNTHAVYSFAVSESGYVAVGLVSHEVLLLDPQGQLLRCFRFNARADYGLVFLHDTLGIVISNRLMTVTLDGTPVDCSETDYGVGASFLRGTYGRYCESVTVGDITYRLENDLGAIQSIGGQYGALVKVDAQGNRSFLYDARTLHNIRTALVMILVLIFFVVGAFTVVRTIRKTKKTEKPAIYTAEFWQ